PGTTAGGATPQGRARKQIRENLNAVTSLPLTPVLVGPTAVGKTAVAAAWAETESISVVSADARQVYRGLDIGTAKPSGALLARVPHLGLDVVEPGERYSAGRFARDAAQWLGQMRSWALYNVQYPYGTSLEYDFVTIDTYASLADAERDISAIFAKVHPSAPLSDIGSRTEAARSLVRGEVWSRIDSAP